MKGCGMGECSACEISKKKVRTESERKTIINRINRIEGQIRGIRSMISEDRYCDDVLTQISAARESLSSLGRKILEEHLRTCIADRLAQGDVTAVDELVSTIERYK